MNSFILSLRLNQTNLWVFLLSSHAYKFMSLIAICVFALFCDMSWHVQTQTLWLHVFHYSCHYDCNVVTTLSRISSYTAVFKEKCICSIQLHIIYITFISLLINQSSLSNIWCKMLVMIENPTKFIFTWIPKSIGALWFESNDNCNVSRIMIL